VNRTLDEILVSMMAAEDAGSPVKQIAITMRDVPDLSAGVGWDEDELAGAIRHRSMTVFGVPVKLVEVAQ